MTKRCPLCGQSLPEAIDEHVLAHRVEKLISPALSGEKKKLEEEYRQRAAADRKSVQLEAERRVRRDLLRLEHRAERAEREKEQAVERVRREAERAAERNVAKEMRLVTQEYEAKLEKVEAAREKDRVRHEGDRARLQAQLDVISRKLEKQTGEQLGDEAEVDLKTQLTAAFPRDHIERIGRGVKGADVVQHVLDEGKEVGRIVYESKNVSTWQTKFLTQAKKYQTQYDTPHILIVTRAFPRKKKGLCIIKNVPIVEARMAVALATVIRDGLVEIGRLRLTGAARETKAQELFDYIVSDKFRTGFCEVAESVASLREDQQEERG